MIILANLLMFFDITLTIIHQLEDKHKPMAFTELSSNKQQTHLILIIITIVINNGDPGLDYIRKRIYFELIT